MSSFSRGYRRWSALAAIVTFGSCMYFIPHYIQQSKNYAKISRAESKTCLSNIREPTTGTSHTQAQPDYNDFYLSAVNKHNISYFYSKKWVGFPEFDSVNCYQALNSPTLNRLYPSQVHRTFPSDFLTDTPNCTLFVHKYGYLRYPTVTQEELDFPIAFVLLFHRDLDQVNFFLRAIYRPHNVYCLYVDTKSSVEFLDATRSIARCLPNVFVSSKLENIVYAGYSRLMADLHCFGDLLKHPVQWKYLLNSPGQAFPLRTNLEMVRILKLFNGTNDIEAKTGSQRVEERYLTQWEYIKNVTSGEITLRQTSKKHPPPPHGLEIVKCSAYGSFTRSFVEFILTNQVAKDLLEWTKPVYSPDELYWATLNYNSVVPAPGGFAGVLEERFWLTSFSVWEAEHDFPCITKFVRGVCIFTPGDLPMLVKQHELFANKFYITHHPVALHCLDQLIYNLTFLGTVRDIQFYESLNLTFRKKRKY